MSILQQSDIQYHLNNRTFVNLIERGQKYIKKTRFHIHGDDKAAHISIIDGHEKSKALREKYTRTNKDLFTRLGRPIDKVFSAKGGSFYLNLSDESQKRASALLSNVAAGMSFKKYIQTHWAKRMADDPYGLLFMEIMDVKRAAIAKQRSIPRTYPTYKPITDIHQYEPSGNRIEWVMFNVSKKDKLAMGLKEDKTYYRLVDDEKDCIVLYESETATIINSAGAPIYQNYFGYVPAMRNSDIPDPLCEEGVLSFFDECFELADDFLTTGSIKAVNKFRIGLPKYAEFADTCKTCKGEGVYEGNEKCKDCNGTGVSLMSKPGDVKALTWPEKNDVLIKPSEVAAFITPGKDFYEVSTQEMQLLENLAYQTLWGSQSKVKTQGMGGPEVKTATEVMDDMQPQADRLHVISDMADARTKFIVDCIVKIEISPNYQGCSYSGGRRYLLEGPDVIWEKYLNAKAKGAPQNVLDELLNEFYEEKFESDRIGLEIAQKLMYVEPFVHMTIQQVQTLNVSEEAYKAKLYYSDWLAQVSEPELMVKTTAELREGLAAFVSTKAIAKPEPKQIGNAA